MLLSCPASGRLMPLHPGRERQKRSLICDGADLPTALARVSGAWLIAMPISACNLILVTAAEEKVLVGDPLFGHVLPLAARGDTCSC